MNSVLDRIKKNSTIKEASLLRTSKIFGKKDSIPTPVPMINVALSGDPDGGLQPGVLVLAGPSKHFKTLFGLLMAAAYMKKYPEAVLLFYDSEFGTPEKYFDNLDIDKDRVVHTPITDIEQLKSDLMNQLKELNRGDKVVVLIDSIGNLASIKEIEDALEGKQVADMTRARALKSFYRMVTPHLTIKDIPLIAINHTYQTMEMFSKAVVSGGTGQTYSADNIWIIGRQQDKNDKTKTVEGYHFIINIEKSRYVIEKSKIPISVTYDAGINKWSGLLDLAVEANLLCQPAKGKYQRVDENGEAFGPEYKEAAIIANDEVWTAILEETTFKQYLIDKYKLSGNPLLSKEQEAEEEVEE